MFRCFISVWQFRYISLSFLSDVKIASGSTLSSELNLNPRGKTVLYLEFLLR